VPPTIAGNTCSLAPKIIIMATPWISRPRSDLGEQGAAVRGAEGRAVMEEMEPGRRSRPVSGC
jgi:hypothetical protein